MQVPRWLTLESCRVLSLSLQNLSQPSHSRKSPLNLRVVRSYRRWQRFVIPVSPLPLPAGMPSAALRKRSSSARLVSYSMYLCADMKTRVSRLDWSSCMKYFLLACSIHCHASDKLHLLSTDRRLVAACLSVRLWLQLT